MSRHHPASPDFHLSLQTRANFKTLFSTPKAPVIPPPAPMPDVDTAQVAAAKKRAMQASSQRTGRASTIMTDYGAQKSSKFGGGV